MLAIVLGYTEKGSSAAPTVLYAGRDATAADVQSLTPPAGFIRTELIKHPVIQRRREYPENLAPEVPADITTEAELGVAPELLPANSPEEPTVKESKKK